MKQTSLKIFLLIATLLTIESCTLMPQLEDNQPPCSTAEQDSITYNCLPALEIAELPAKPITRNRTSWRFVRYEPYLDNWLKLEDGLEYAEFSASIPAKMGDNRIKVLRADPEFFNLKLLSVTQVKTPLLSAPEWLNKYDLVAVINAGMFKKNYRTSVSFMKNFKHFNNRKHKKEYKSYIAFNPKQQKKHTLKPFTILEADQPDFKKEHLSDYNTVVQNMRMIDLNGQNLWTPSAKHWSISALAADRDGKILLLFSRSPFTVHDFNENLLQLPLNLKNAAYLEGGPPCFLGVSTEALAMNETGSFESGFRENNTNRKFQKVPNVLGLVRRSEEAEIVEAAPVVRKKKHKRN